MRKYGWESFTKEIIATTDTQEKAQLLEESLIKKYDSVKNGYNDCYSGSGGNLFGEMTPFKQEKFRKKMSRITAGEKNGMFGKKQSDESKAKQREKAKGRFTMPWYISRYGKEEGTKLYNARSEKLRQRNLVRNEKGRFDSVSTI
jgi:hypothetical protein